MAGFLKGGSSGGPLQPPSLSSVLANVQPVQPSFAGQTAINASVMPQWMPNWMQTGLGGLQTLGQHYQQGMQNYQQAMQPFNFGSQLGFGMMPMQMPQQMQGSALRGLSNGLSGLQGLLGKL